MHTIDAHKKEMDELFDELEVKDNTIEEMSKIIEDLQREQVLSN
jgi:hypothetical protein